MNTYAIMAQRKDNNKELDFFPTPLWATRALLENVLIWRSREDFKRRSCLEPACGAGHMSKVLLEYFGSVTSQDIYDRGYGRVGDFLAAHIEPQSYDWVITNPPFNLAEEFILKSLDIARDGVAMITRTSFLESIGRYERLFSKRPPSIVAQFVERCAMLKGRLDRNATTATSYCWMVWSKSFESKETRLVWIPPCRKALERDGDYDEIK